MVYFVALLLLILSPAISIPSFHTVNDFNLQHEVCPLPTLYDQPCLPLCVLDISDCPNAHLSNFYCTEQPGLMRCADGTCQSDCSQVSNPCQCGSTTTNTNYMSCGELTSPLSVTVVNMDPQFKAQRIAEECTLALNGSSAGGGEVWSEEGNRSKFVWLDCPIPAEPQFSEMLTLLPTLIFFGIVVFELLLFGAWCLVKFYLERGISYRSLTEKGDTSFPLGSVILGYRSHWLGSLVFQNIYVVSVFFLVGLSILVGDNYGTFYDTYYYFFLSSAILSKVFVIMWFITAAWFVTLFLLKHRLPNMFRVACADLSSAQVVQIDQPLDINSPVVMLGEGHLALWLIRFDRVYQAVQIWLRLDRFIDTQPVTHLKNSNRKFFQFQGCRYVMEPNSNQFSLPLHPSNNACGDNLGLSDDQVSQLKEQFGPNQIIMNRLTVGRAICDEFFQFTYLYQMMFLWVWYFFTYYQMGLVQTGVILVSAVVQITLRLRADARVHKLTEVSGTYQCKRQINGLTDWCSVLVSELVPGDLIRLQSTGDGLTIPCDGVLLQGEVIVDESMLTGEAMPIRKLPSSLNQLAAGTKLLQITNQATSTMRVTRIGIHTDKGQLIQNILYPKPTQLLFHLHLRLILCLLLTWGLVCFGLSMYLMGRGDINSWFYGMFVISQIISPLLPSALAAGQSIARTRLHAQHQINCVDLTKLIMAGKINRFCFDKTGTLTKEGLEFYGFIPTLITDQSGSDRIIFDNLTKDPIQLPQLCQLALATCHDATKLQNKDQPIGNPVDLEQFMICGWQFSNEFDQTLYEGAFINCNNKEKGVVKIVKRNRFLHSRASMSVIVEDESGCWHVFIKGSYEHCRSVVTDNNSLPSNYNSLTQHLAKEGCYVLGLVHYELGLLPRAEDRLRILALSRDELEYASAYQPKLAGLLLFKNQLKPETKDLIEKLQEEGDIGTLMITGDNAYTGIHIGRMCRMIKSEVQVLLLTLEEDFIRWVDIDTDQVIKSELSIAQYIQQSTHPVQLAVTGPGFTRLADRNQLDELLPYIKIYARMTPDGKVRCIEHLIDQGLVVGMCGDGGNDCGALRVAHVGLALSDAEASLVAPFSSTSRSPMDCFHLVRYGRGALASSLSCYKYLILYGEIMVGLELSQFYFSVIVSQPIWISVDGFITTLMILGLALAKPALNLAPTRPTAKLLGPLTILSCLLHTLINWVFLGLALALLFRQEFFKCHEFDGSTIDTAKWWLLGDNYEASIIGLVSLAQFINMGFCFNFGHRYRGAWYKNYYLVAAYIALVSLVVFLIMADPNPLSCWYRINCGTSQALSTRLHKFLSFSPPLDYNSPQGHNVMPQPFRTQLLLLILTNGLVSILLELHLQNGTRFINWLKKNP